MEKHQQVLINLVINAVGAATTATAHGVIVIAKFAEGGWITIVAISCVIVLHKAIKRYYEDIEQYLRDDGALEFRRSEPPNVLVMDAGMESPDRQGAAAHHGGLARYAWG